MRKLRIGDKVNMHDWSWSFGIENGKYSSYFDKCGKQEGLTVIKTGLNAMGNADGDRTGQFTEICDILVTDGQDGFWFTRSEFLKLSEHTVSFDGGEPVTISDQFYQALKKSLTQ